MKTEKEQPEKMISVPEKAFLRMVIKLNEGKILFPKKVEDAREFLKGVALPQSK
jgi:hypothetical protein